MSFLESPRFPECISLGAVGGPEFSTTVTVVDSGYEQRNRNWLYPRGRWNVSQGVRSDSDMRELIAFYRVAGGEASGFRFKDHSDYADADSGMLGTTGTGDGTTTAFQMYKQYVTGSTAANRMIQKPVSGTVTIFRAGTLVPTAQYTVDYTKGLVTFTSAPASGASLVWFGQFDVPCRFDTDAMRITIVNKGAQGPLWESWEDIPLVEIRV